MAHFNRAGREKILRSVAIGAFMVSLAVPRAVFADTIDPAIGAGIGTAVDDVFGDGTNVAIRTSITSVTYGQPVHVHRDGLSYLELKGSVQGVGWGGRLDSLEAPPQAAEAHYGYDVPFVLRWRQNFDGTLLYYAHGTPNLAGAALIDSILGDADESRRIDELESLYIAQGALEAKRGHALFSPNLGGLRRDGSFSVIGLEGDFVGQPLNPSVDAPITRDLALVAERLLDKFSRRRVERSIGLGHSGGALIMQYIAGGVTTPLDGPHASTRVFTGGNFVNAYAPSSGTIFEGVIPITADSPLLNPQFPFTAPVLMLAGEADFSPPLAVHYTSRLFRAGVDLNANVRIYQIANMPHNFGDLVEVAPNVNRVIGELEGFEPSADSERMAPVVAAAVDNMVAWLTRGKAPPISRINARLIDTDTDGEVDTVAFDQTGGQTTTLFPFVRDPSLDVTFAPQFEISIFTDPLFFARYVEVLDNFDHISEPLVLPYAECRVGGYEFAIDAFLVPFPDLDAVWPSFGRYRACVNRAIHDLDRTGLYDGQIARDSVFTDEILGLFGR